MAASRELAAGRRSPIRRSAGLPASTRHAGYDVGALVEKSGKSASRIYARLSLLQLIPAIAEAFTQERIIASHANLLARLPQNAQATAYEQCWRKDWQDKKPHLLPANVGSSGRFRGFAHFAARQACKRCSKGRPLATR